MELGHLNELVLEEELDCLVEELGCLGEELPHGNLFFDPSCGCPSSSHIL